MFFVGTYASTIFLAKSTVVSDEATRDKDFVAKWRDREVWALRRRASLSRSEESNEFHFMKWFNKTPFNCLTLCLILLSLLLFSL